MGSFSVTFEAGSPNLIQPWRSLCPRPAGGKRHHNRTDPAVGLIDGVKTDIGANATTRNRYNRKRASVVTEAYACRPLIRRSSRSMLGGCEAGAVPPPRDRPEQPVGLPANRCAAIGLDIPAWLGCTWSSLGIELVIEAFHGAKAFGGMRSKIWLSESYRSSVRRLVTPACRQRLRKDCHRHLIRAPVATLFSPSAAAFADRPPPSRPSAASGQQLAHPHVAARRPSKIFMLRRFGLVMYSAVGHAGGGHCVVRVQASTRDRFSSLPCRASDG